MSFRRHVRGASQRRFPVIGNENSSTAIFLSSRLFVFWAGPTQFVSADNIKLCFYAALASIVKQGPAGGQKRYPTTRLMVPPLPLTFPSFQ